MLSISCDGIYALTPRFPFRDQMIDFFLMLVKSILLSLSLIFFFLVLSLMFIKGFYSF